MSFGKLDYCQYLLSSPVTYTVTNLAEPLDGVSHERINRYLRGEKLSPGLLWENVKGSVVNSVYSDVSIENLFRKVCPLNL